MGRSARAGRRGKCRGRPYAHGLPLGDLLAFSEFNFWLLDHPTAPQAALKALAECNTGCRPLRPGNDCLRGGPDQVSPSARQRRLARRPHRNNRRSAAAAVPHFCTPLLLLQQLHCSTAFSLINALVTCCVFPLVLPSVCALAPAKQCGARRWRSLVLRWQPGGAGGPCKRRTRCRQTLPAGRSV